MKTLRKHFITVDEYIASFPSDTKRVLQKIRETIVGVIPDATELISYNIPAYRTTRNLVYFAGFAHHVSMYPIPPGSVSFRKAVAPYVKGKGTLRFDLSKPIPYRLVKQVVLAAVRARKV